MTVMKPANESQERVSFSVSELQKPKELSSPGLGVESGDLAGKVSKDERKLEETEESPKSVGKWGKYVHSQILRIREEDSHLGEDFSLSVKENGHLSVLYHHHHHHDHVDAAPMDVLIFSKPILPNSPLSRKTTNVEALH
jgi:hypothetical protein